MPKKKFCGTDSIFCRMSGPLDIQIRKAEVKATRFIGEHNLSLAADDHLGPLFKDYACRKIKSTCVSNRAIKADLQKY